MRCVVSSCGPSVFWFFSPVCSLPPFLLGSKDFSLSPRRRSHPTVVQFFLMMRALNVRTALPSFLSSTFFFFFSLRRLICSQSNHFPCRSVPIHPSSSTVHFSSRSSGMLVTTAIHPAPLLPLVPFFPSPSVRLLSIVPLSMEK